MEGRVHCIYDCIHTACVGAQNYLDYSRSNLFFPVVSSASKHAPAHRPSSPAACTLCGASHKEQDARTHTPTHHTQTHYFLDRRNTRYARANYHLPLDFFRRRFFRHCEILVATPTELFFCGRTKITSSESFRRNLHTSKLFKHIYSTTNNYTRCLQRSTILTSRMSGY